MTYRHAKRMLSVGRRGLPFVLQRYYDETMPSKYQSNDRSPSHYFAATSRNRQGASSQLVSVRLPVDLLERLATVGNEQGLALSDTIRLVLERGLNERKKSK